MKRLTTVVVSVVLLSAGIQYSEAATKSSKAVGHSKVLKAKALKKTAQTPALALHLSLSPAPLQIETQTPVVLIESETVHVDSETVEIESATVKVETETVELESETVHVETSTAIESELSHSNNSQHSENHQGHDQIAAATRESSQEKD
jgi:hypothetical protein